MKIVCGLVELIAGEQAARVGADEVQLESFGGQAGGQPHRHPGFFLQFAAAGDDRLGDATDQRGRLDGLLDRLEDVPSLVGVRSRCEQHGQRRHLARELVARVRCGLQGSLPRLARGGDPDSDPHISMMRRLGPKAAVMVADGDEDLSRTAPGVELIAVAPQPFPPRHMPTVPPLLFGAPNGARTDRPTATYTGAPAQTVALSRGPNRHSVVEQFEVLVGWRLTVPR